MTEHIYLMELQNGKYYVGKTKNFERRMDQHQTKFGAAFTKLHGPSKLSTSLMQVQTCSAGEETKNTLKYMISHGINNVRGAEYCQIEEFKLEDCKRMSYAACHHLGTNPEEIEQIFRDQITSSEKLISSEKEVAVKENFLVSSEKEDNLLYENLKKTKLHVDNHDNFLYENLKKIRLNLSKEMKVEPYMVFTNETLQYLVEFKPKNLKDLKNIKGFGDVKIQKFGNVIIEEINSQKCIVCFENIKCDPSKKLCLKCWRNSK